MAQSGHLRELKEVKSLPAFLEQSARQELCDLYVLQLNGAIFYHCCYHSKAALLEPPIPLGDAILARWQQKGLPSQAPTSLELDGVVWLVLPIVVHEQVNGLFAVSPFRQETQSFWHSVVEMMVSLLVLARAAVNELKRNSNILSLHEDLYREIEQVDTPEQFCEDVLALLYLYLETEISLFIPRNVETAKWEQAFKRSSHALSVDWLAALVSTITALHNAERCPLLLTLENRADYPELIQLGITSLISVTIRHEGDLLGLIVFCSLGLEQMLSFDHLALLESIKGMISLRLYNLYYGRLRESFLQNAFHNLKTPVHSINGIIEALLADQTKSLYDRQDLLHPLTQQVQRLVRLTKLAEKWTQVQHSTQQWEKVSLTTLVLQCAEAFRPLSNKKNVSLSIDVPADLCDIMANCEDLLIVLENLLSNSLKYSLAGQTIYLELSIEKADYRLRVCDEGPGVPKEYRKIIFDEFISISRPGVAESTGLGLAISRKIVELYGGTLSCDDGPNQRGACFSFTLPRPAPSA
ncbi:MAG: HAMP domain-containing sensor histidine kinase [Caldilineaceae bacterium]